MRYSYLPPYGHACCPHCRQEFDLKLAKPTLREKATHGDVLIYVMCRECHANYQSGDEQRRKEMSNACFVNFKLCGVSVDGGMFPFAVTSTLTLALNTGDLAEAIEHGHGLTRAEYDSLCEQDIEVSTLPGGLSIISKTPRAR